MKKIAVVVTEFIAGGVEKALLELINAIDRNNIEITVFLPNKNGQWTHLLEEKVNVVVLQEDSIEPVKSVLSKFNIFLWFKFLFFRLKSKIIIQKNYSKGLEYRLKGSPMYPEKFDVAIAYKMSNIDIVLNCLYYINSDKKIAWVHQTFNKTEEKYIEYYNRFNKIFCVSKALEKQTVNMFPSLKDKTDIFHNILNHNEIKKLSTEYFPKLKPKDELFAIATVGRLSAEKGQDIIPAVAYSLRNKGYNFVWYLIGDGMLKQKIQEKIKQYNIEDNIVLCGKLDNPYPYIKNCDIYVQTSKTEGWGLTVSEAKIFHRPIVTTNAGVMHEQINHGVNGLIVDKYSVEKICAGIEQLMKDSTLREKFIMQLKKEDNSADTRKSLQKLYELM